MIWVAFATGAGSILKKFYGSGSATLFSTVGLWFSSAKTHYYVELLAAYSAVKHFRFLLEGRNFTLFTDHKPLTFALFRVCLPWSASPVLPV